MVGDGTETAESSSAIGVKRAKPMNRNKVELAPVVERIAELLEEKSDVKSVITKFRQRKDRDANMD